MIGIPHIIPSRIISPGGLRVFLPSVLSISWTGCFRYCPYNQYSAVCTLMGFVKGALAIWEIQYPRLSPPCETQPYFDSFGRC